MDAVYRDVPLTSPTSFCLLEISDEEPSNHPDSTTPILCRLHAADLQEHPHFEALSYMWGSLDVTKTIFVNDHPFQVREKLWDFLCERRSRKSWVRDSRNFIRYYKLLWIDAICIDQTTIPERNHQVSVMGQIYSNAALVISWLGKGDESLLIAMENLIRSFPTLLLADTLGEAHDRTLLLRSGEELNIYLSGLNEYQLRVIKASVLSCANYHRSLYLHEYWTRVWIIQEVALPLNVEMWCTEYSVSLGFVDFVGKVLEELAGSGQSKKDIIGSPIRKLMARRWQLHNGDKKNDFISLLLLSSKCGCSNPQDRIYAILPLMDSEERAKLDITPNYSSSREELFHEVVKKTITHGDYVTEERCGPYICLLLATIELDASHLDQETIWGRVALEQ